MTKFSDTQRVLLSNASQRDDGSVLPLTGLRKQGHAIERTKRDDVTCYRIAASA